MFDTYPYYHPLLSARPQYFSRKFITSNFLAVRNNGSITVHLETFKGIQFNTPPPPPGLCEFMPTVYHNTEASSYSVKYLIIAKMLHLHRVSILTSSSRFSSSSSSSCDWLNLNCSFCRMWVSSNDRGS